MVPLYVYDNKTIFLFPKKIKNIDKNIYVMSE